MARGQIKSGDNKYTPKNDTPLPPKPGAMAPRSGQALIRGKGGADISQSGELKISTSNGKFGGPPREENWADKIIEKVFGDNR